MSKKNFHCARVIYIAKKISELYFIWVSLHIHIIWTVDLSIFPRYSVQRFSFKHDYIILPRVFVWYAAVNFNSDLSVRNSEIYFVHTSCNSFVLLYWFHCSKRTEINIIRKLEVVSKAYLLIRSLSYVDCIWISTQMKYSSEIFLMI